MRYEGKAAIRQADQEVGVDYSYMVRPSGEGRGEWFGRFTAAEERLATGEAVLVLPRGASGRIIIDNIDERTGRSGTFMGIQAPPGYDS